MGGKKWQKIKSTSSSKAVLFLFKTNPDMQINKLIGTFEDSLPSKIVLFPVKGWLQSFWARSEAKENDDNVQ